MTAAPARGRARIALILAASLALPSAGPGGASPGGAGPDALFGRALAAWGLDRSAIRLDPDEMGLWRGDEHRLPLFDLLLADPLRLEPYTRSFREQGLEAAESAGDLLAFAAWRAGLPVRRGLVADADPLPGWRQEASRPGALAAALALLEAGAGGEPAPAGSHSHVPRAAAEPAALMLRAIAEALRWRQAALEPLAGGERTLRQRALMSLTASPATATGADLLRSLERDGARVDLRRLVAGAGDLARAADAAAEMLRAPAARDAGAFDVRFETPQGAVLLRGTGRDRLEPGDSGAAGILLLIDLGGDDVYGTAGAVTGAAGIQVWIDAAGNDVYRAAAGEAGAFGAGVAGCGLLLDLGGDDVYEAGPVSLGAGMWGVGLLLDAEGRDRYSAAEFAQGAGTFGLGLLADLAGDDTYRAVQMAQGFGGVAGAGILADRMGNDRYEAVDPQLRHPSAQSPEHGTSLSQGCAAGDRADYLHGHSRAGGLGMLLEGEGNDVYRAGVFAQGCGYWYGIGILSDGAGDDDYEAVWYAQGSAAHFAMGFLLDESGDDRTAASHNMAQGAGHDFSVGALVDVTGDDLRLAPNLALGAGHDNGIGLFWDRGGNDRYEATGPLAFGRARLTAAPGGPRDQMKTVGLFLDTGGGRDVYPGPQAAPARNGRTWRQPTTPGAPPTVTGAGRDR